MSEKSVAIGPRIASWRLRRGFSQVTVSRRAKLDQSYLSRLEAGKIQPNLRTAQRIATALRISLPDLLASTPPEQSEGSCPVSLGGQCLIDLVDSGFESKRNKTAERYSPRQLRLIRRFAALVEQDEKEVLTALDVLIGRMLKDGSRKRSPSPSPRRDRKTK